MSREEFFSICFDYILIPVKTVLYPQVRSHARAPCAVIAEGLVGASGITCLKDGYHCIPATSGFSGCCEVFFKERLSA